MSNIKLKDRDNIKVYNTCASIVCMSTPRQEFRFEGASDGVWTMYQMSFADIEFANSRNPELFASGMLTFDESERNEIYCALNHSNWEERFWTDEIIEDALLRPTKAKMDRILAVRDVLTIERIRGVMTYIINTNIQKPIDRVISLVNDRCQELFRGIKKSRLVVILPDSVLKEDAEKKALKEKNDAMEAELRLMKEQIAALMAVQKAPDSAQASAPVAKKPAGRPKKTE